MAGPSYPLRLPTRLSVLWRMTVLGLTLGVLTARVWDWTQGRPFGTVPTLVVMGVAVPMVLLQYVGLAGRAGEAGLRLFDGWGWPRHLTWPDIAQVELARWPWLLFAPSLKLTSRNGRVHWLPRDTNGLDALHALALRHGGPAHPLVRVLETPLHRL